VAVHQPAGVDHRRRRRAGLVEENLTVVHGHPKADLRAVGEPAVVLAQHSLQRDRQVAHQLAFRDLGREEDDHAVAGVVVVAGLVVMPEGPSVATSISAGRRGRSAVVLRAVTTAEALHIDTTIARYTEG